MIARVGQIPVTKLVGERTKIERARYVTDMIGKHQLDRFEKILDALELDKPNRVFNGKLTKITNKGLEDGKKTVKEIGMRLDTIENGQEVSYLYTGYGVQKRVAWNPDGSIQSYRSDTDNTSVSWVKNTVNKERGTRLGALTKSYRGKLGNINTLVQSADAYHNTQFTKGFALDPKTKAPIVEVSKKNKPDCFRATKITSRKGETKFAELTEAESTKFYNGNFEKEL